jgi:5-methylcytosine-specific restriction endonuclease McrA
MRVLALNKSYIPVRLASVYSAIGKFYVGIAEAIIVENSQYTAFNFEQWLARSLLDVWPKDQRFINSVSQRIAVPSVIRYLKYDKIPKTSVRMSRKSIYERDDHTCYLCGQKLSETHLTLDHVIPVSKGGRSDWANLATCCAKCNCEKGDKLLSELKIRPKFAPYKPTVSNMSRLRASVAQYQQEWALFGF